MKFSKSLVILSLKFESIYFSESSTRLSQTRVCNLGWISLTPGFCASIKRMFTLSWVSLLGLAFQWDPLWVHFSWKEFLPWPEIASTSGSYWPDQIQIPSNKEGGHFSNFWRFWVFLYKHMDSGWSGGSSPYWPVPLYISTIELGTTSMIQGPINRIFDLSPSNMPS